jgi:hypothetical protein
MGICVTEINLVIIVILAVAFIIYIVNKTTVQPSFIKSEFREHPKIYKTETHLNTTFPLGKYVGRDFDKGTVGYIVDDSGNQFPLNIQRYYNKYYYYTNMNNLSIEVDSNPKYFDLMDNDDVTVNGKSYKAKIYRTSF